MQSYIVSFILVNYTIPQVTLYQKPELYSNKLMGMTCSFSLRLVTSVEGKSSGTKVYAHQMVRTDSREQTLHAFLPPKGHADVANAPNRYNG